MTLNVTASLRVAKGDFNDEYDRYSSSLLAMCMILLLAVFVLFLSFGRWFSALTDLDPDLLFPLIGFSFASFVIHFMNTKLRFQYKYIIISLVTIVANVSSVLLSIWFILRVFPERAFYGKILGQVIPYIAISILLLVLLLKSGRPSFKSGYIKYALSFSIPLIPHNLSAIVNNHFDRILINKFLGFSDAGIYSFAYNVGTIVAVIFFALNKAWEPWFFETYKKKSYSRLLERSKDFVSVFSLLYSLALLFVPEITRILAEGSYLEGLRIVPIIFAAYYIQFLYTFELFIEFSNKKSSFTSIGTMLSAVVNIVLNLIFIPIFGYVGAAITTVISFFLLFFYHYWFTHKKLESSIYTPGFYLSAFARVISVTALYYLAINSFLFRLAIAMFLTASFFLKQRKRIARA